MGSKAVSRRRQKNRRVTSPDGKSAGQHFWPAAALLLAIVVIAYIPVWRAGFIWDDDQHLTKNPCIIGPSTFADIWTSTQAYYYPLVLTTFWFVHQVAGLNPLPYHLMNVLMHAGSAVVLWQVQRKLNIRAAWAGAALWAVHPVMVQSVAWVTELKNTQSAFFYLLSILFFLKWDDVKKQSLFAFSLLFFVMAITSKTSTVMLPVALGLCLWWRHNRVTIQDFVRLIPFFAISAAASAWTIWEQKYHSGAQGVRFALTWPDRFAVAGYDLWFYLSKLLWPTGLSFFYPQWKIDNAGILAFVPLLLALIGAGLLFWKRNGSLRPVFFSTAYFVVSLFPVLSFFNVFFFRYSFVSDHFQYLAAMGPLALAAAAVSFGLEKFGNANWFPRVAFVALLVLAVGTWRQASNYVDAEHVYRMAIDRNPECWPAYTNLGAQFLQEQRFDEALEHCQKALTIKPDVAETQYNLGNCYLAKRDFAAAIPAYEAALRLQPNNARTHSNLAACLVSTGSVERALEQWQDAIRADPNYADAHYNLGYVLGQLGRRDEAISHLKEAVRIRPDYAAARQQLQVLSPP